MIDLLERMSTKDVVIMAMAIMFFGNLAISFIFHAVFTHFSTNKALKRINAIMFNRE